MIEKIGAGGMGVVYRARDLRLERDVAVKVLATGVLADETARKQFRKEALALSRLNHPNVAMVFDFDTYDGIDFIVTEFIPGVPLDKRVVTTSVAAPEVLVIGLQLAQGLHAVHSQGVVHGDLKPSNMLLTPQGLLKILDFGLANFVSKSDSFASTTTLPRIPAFSGTLPYAAPEQLRGERANFGSDLWATGVVLYELTTQRRPFEERTEALLIDAILNKNPVSPKALNADVPSELEMIILRSLAKDPKLRYQRAQDLVRDIESVQAGRAVHGSVNQSRVEVLTEQPRILEAAAQKESTVGRSTEIVAMVRCKESRGLREYLTNEAIPCLSREQVRERPFKLHFESDAHGKAIAAAISLRLDSPDFEPRTQTKKLQVPPQGDSAPCSFLVTPRMAGELVLNLELLNRNEELLVSRSLRMRAGREKDSASVEHIMVSIPLLVVVHKPDLLPTGIGLQVDTELQPSPAQPREEFIVDATSISPEAGSLAPILDPPPQAESTPETGGPTELSGSAFTRQWLLWTGSLVLVLSIFSASLYWWTRPVALPNREAVDRPESPQSTSESLKMPPPVTPDHSKTEAVQISPAAPLEDGCPNCFIASPRNVLSINPKQWPKLVDLSTEHANSISFGSVDIGQARTTTLTIRNTDSSTMRLRITRTTITGEGARAFSVLAAENTCDTQVPAGKECSLRIRFTPSRTRDYKADLQITGKGGSTQVELSGSGK